MLSLVSFLYNLRFLDTLGVSFLTVCYTYVHVCSVVILFLNCFVFLWGHEHLKSLADNARCAWDTHIEVRFAVNLSQFSTGDSEREGGMVAVVMSTEVYPLKGK